jgi:hypothetical protein
MLFMAEDVQVSFIIGQREKKKKKGETDYAEKGEKSCLPINGISDSKRSGCDKNTRE